MKRILPFILCFFAGGLFVWGILSMTRKEAQPEMTFYRLNFSDPDNQEIYLDHLDLVANGEQVAVVNPGNLTVRNPKLSHVEVHLFKDRQDFYGHDYSIFPTSDEEVVNVAPAADYFALPSARKMTLQSGDQIQAKVTLSFAESEKPTTFTKTLTLKNQLHTQNE